MSRPAALQDGELVQFSEVQGMTQLDGHKPIKVKNCKVGAAGVGGSSRAAAALPERAGRGSWAAWVDDQHQPAAPLPTIVAANVLRTLRKTCAASASPAADSRHAPPQAHTFELDLDTSAYGNYTRGGLVQQVKQPKTLAFKTLAQALAAPGEFLLSDFSKMDRPAQLHAGFQALHRFEVGRGCGGWLGVCRGVCVLALPRRLGSGSCARLCCWGGARIWLGWCTTVPLTMPGMVEQALRCEHTAAAAPQRLPADYAKHGGRYWRPSPCPPVLTCRTPAPHSRRRSTATHPAPPTRTTPPRWSSWPRRSTSLPLTRWSWTRSCWPCWQATLQVRGR
jgi:hypothetical protein